MSERFADLDPNMLEIYKKRNTDYRLSAKLLGLVNLLQDCEIITEESEEKKASDFKKPAAKKRSQAAVRQDEAGETDSLGNLALASVQVKEAVQEA